MRLSGRTVLITGGGSGLGFALAEKLLEKGNTVIAVGRNEERLAAARAKAPKLLTHAGDAGTKEGVAALARWVEAEHRGLDVLVNNAALYVNWDALKDTSVEPLEREVELNLLGPVRLSHALLPLLRRQSEAAIINVTSAAADVPTADAPMYCATKAAMHCYTDSLRYQLRETAVKVVELVPPTVESDMSAGRFKGQGRMTQAMDVNAFAQAAIAGLENDVATIRVGKAKLYFHAARLLPGIVRKQSLAMSSKRG